MSINQKNQKDVAVSEVVAVILLVGLVISSISIITVMLLSSPPPSDIPKSNIQIIYPTEEGSSKDKVFFYHGGGDPIREDDIQIKVDDTILDRSEYDFYRNEDGVLTPVASPVLWNYSSVIEVNAKSNKRYQILFTSGSTSQILKEFHRGDMSVGKTPSYAVCKKIDPDFRVNPSPSIGRFSYNLISNVTTNPDPRNISSFYIFEGKNYQGWDVTINLPVSSGKESNTYPVQRVVSNTTDDGSSCDKSSIVYIPVQCNDPICSAEFSYRLDSTTGQVIFSDKSPNAKQWTWILGDGNVISGQDPSLYKNPSHLYTDGKFEHDVTLEIVTERCGQNFTCSSKRKVKTESIVCDCFTWDYDTSSREPWNVTFRWNPHSVCSGLYHSGNEKDWKVTFDFGDGSVPVTKYKPGLGYPITDEWGTQNRIEHSYPAPCVDSYSVKMEVQDLSGGIYYSCIRSITLPCPCITDKPVANFTVTGISPSNFVTTISDHSLPASVPNRRILRWEWDFGDGKTRIDTTSPAPFTHPYDQCGSYVLSLTVFDSMGCWTTTTRTVSCGGGNCEQGDITARFSVAPNSSSPKKFDFTDTSNSVNNTLKRWEWDFGDGTSGINTSSPGPFWIEYDRCSSFPVKLRVWDDIGCWDDFIQQVSCSCPNPVVRYRYDQNPINPLRYQFYDESDSVVGSIKDRIWEFGDGVRSNLQNPSHTYSIPGQYTVRLTVMNDCGSTNDTIFDIMDGCPPPVSDFEYRCIGERTVNFTDLSRGKGNGIKSWYWEFGDTRLDNRSSLQNPTHEYDNPGTYQVNLTISTTCDSSARWTRQVTVPCCHMPTADFKYTCLEDGNTIQFNDTTKLYGDTISSWNWNFGDGSSAIGPTPKKTFVNSGTYPVNLTVTTACGAKNSWIHNITVPCLCSPPLASFNTEIITRKPFTLRFTDTSDPKDGQITHWNWTFGDGTTHSGQNPPDKVYSKCGEYIANLRVTNDCGAYDDTDRLICCPVFANYTYRMDPPDGDAPVTVYFTDMTEGEPNAWEWNFGDGETSYLQSPVHTYTQGGSYTVSLHATSPCGGNETHSKILTIGCPEVIADFSYTIVTEEPFNVSFRDFSSSGAEIVDWTWFFGDGQTSKEQNPTHQYAGRANYNVGLIVKNSCGNSAQTWRRIAYDCPELTADFFITPSSGQSPLEVQYTDNSTPLGKIMSWLWIFGDGTSYFTTNPNARNPPNHTYTKIGTYYVTLQIKNECGNPFTKVKTVTVANPATISGYLWNDRNMNQVRDPEEVGLPGWVVSLQERIAGVWVDKDSVLTDSQGNYQFTMNDVTYGAFRVLETLQPRWNVTYSYGSGAEPHSSTLLVSSIRNYDEVNFGNVRTNTSTFEFPLRFYYGAVGSGYTGSTYNMNREGQYWDFNTSYNWERQRLFYPPPYRITHTAQGDSSFFVTIGFYARYLIFLSSGSRPPITNSYWLRYWLYPPNAGGTRTNGFDFFVPDNTDIYRPDIFFEQDTVRWFELYIPFEGSTIPYSINSYVEAHMTGTGGSTTGCTLIAPVTQSLTWSTTYGYFTGNWDNTPYEGQWITITARNDFGTAGSPRYISSSKNVFVDWQPVTPVITSPTNNALVQGTANIIATVGGHNRDTDNVRLLIDGQDVGQLAFDSMNNIFTNSLNVEPYAGKTIEVVARAYPLSGQGTFKDSAPIYLRVESLLPIQANFTADPWTGPAPLEVAFTDTSTGGPASWLWTFSPGQTSTEQHPIHVFQNEGNYPVSLEVQNVLGTPSTISRYVNTTGLLNTINLQSTRNGVLLPGYASWIVRGTGSSVTINGIEYPVQSGDRVRLETSISQSSADIRIVGEITAFNVSGVSLSVNGALVDTGTCTAITIHDFENYHSNLKLIAYRHNSALINLLWNGAFVEVPNFRNLEISDIMPYADKTLELRMAPGDIYLDGRASAYRLYT